MNTLSPLRRGRITGSRIGKLFNVSPFGDRDSLMRELVREHFDYPTEFLGNVATRYGLEHEADAVAEYQYLHPSVEITHAGPKQETFLHPTLDVFAVTPDGLLDESGYLEVKCPYSGIYTHISQRADYHLQVMLGLEVTGREWADFAVWRPDGLSVSRVSYDPWWLDTVMPEVERFLTEFRGIVADEALAAPFLTDPVMERTDDDWTEAAVEYLEACLAVDGAEKVKVAARDRLVQLRQASPELPAKGAGVTLVHSVKKTVAYKDALSKYAPDADLGAFTKDGAEVWSVRRTGTT